MPGQRELLLQRSDMLPLTVQVFEMVHFGTYQLDLISTYSRLSAIIEMDVDMAQHTLRKVSIPTPALEFSARNFALRLLYTRFAGVQLNRSEHSEKQTRRTGRLVYAVEHVLEEGPLAVGRDFVCTRPIFTVVE